MGVLTLTEPPTEPPARARGGPVPSVPSNGRPYAPPVDNVQTLRRLESVAFKAGSLFRHLKNVAFNGGTLINRIISFALKAIKLGCVLALAVAPLLNIWQTPRSGQN